MPRPGFPSGRPCKPRCMSEWTSCTATRGRDTAAGFSLGSVGGTVRQGILEFSILVLLAYGPLLGSNRN